MSCLASNYAHALGEDQLQARVQTECFFFPPLSTGIQSLISCFFLPSFFPFCILAFNRTDPFY